MTPTNPRSTAAPGADDAAEEDAGGIASLRPSKTRRKKDMHELQALGEALVALPDERIAALGLEERLVAAVEAYRRTRTHEGRRRQMQYVGKLMRLADPAPIREAAAAMQLGRAHDALALHEAERWRAELLADDEALARWREAHPRTDLQRLRSLVRAARRDAAATPEERSGRAFRELFRFIRAQQAAAPGADAGADDDTEPDDD